MVNAFINFRGCFKMKRRIGRTFTFFLLALLGFLIGMGAYLAFWQGDYIEKSISSSKVLIEKMTAAQLEGEKLKITEQELNDTLQAIALSPIKSGSITVKGVYADISNKDITIYAPMNYKNIELLPNITGNLSYNNERLLFKIEAVKLGKLSIPKGLFINYIKNYSSEDINISNSGIEINSSLLPFKANDIYIEDEKLVVEVEKSRLSQLAEDTEETGNDNEESKPNEEKEPADNNIYDKAQDNNFKNNSKTDTETSDKSNLKTSQKGSLQRVSSQLDDVVADMKTTKDKEMVRKIQSVIKKVAVNPDYSYTKELKEVKAWYNNLDSDEKNYVKNAVISNMDIIEILKLINIFGV